MVDRSRRDQSIGQIMTREPVAEGGTPLRIVSLGDLEMARAEASALADISSASPNN